jgi:aminoglycoside phosphotransferase (APT) family kinase protein
MRAMTENHRSAEVMRQFRIDGELSAIAAYGSGHINDTYCAVFDQCGSAVRFILQRINTAIFKQPFALMENIQRVTSHLAAKMAVDPDGERRVLTLVSARNGRAWYEDTEGGVWRVYRFIESARAYDAVESPQQAFQAAKAFGEFQKLLVDLPAPRLHHTIPDFHNTPMRFKAFEQAVAGEMANRAFNARGEIEFAFARRPIVRILLDAGLPERITHNDTKFNNVLLDDATDAGICVIDLDTVMPGLAVYDFGDMVRTATSASMEDEQDLSRVSMQFPMFDALARGYLSSAGSFLTKEEKAHLAFAGKLITFEQGLRFLTDYLAGDTYYKVHREEQNLDRCRTQFKLVESIEEQEEQMNGLIGELVDG